MIFIFAGIKIEETIERMFQVSRSFFYFNVSVRSYIYVYIPLEHSTEIIIRMNEQKKQGTSPNSSA
jgi:hypothetical protein